MATTEYTGTFKYVDSSGNITALYPDVKTDTGLATSGKPADSKAVGDAIAAVKKIAETEKVTYRLDESTASLYITLAE